MFCNWCWCTDDVDEWNANNSTHAEYIDKRIGNEDSCTHDEEDVDDELESVISHHTSFSDDEISHHTSFSDMKSTQIMSV